MSDIRLVLAFLGYRTTGALLLFYICQVYLAPLWVPSLYLPQVVTASFLRLGSN